MKKQDSFFVPLIITLSIIIPIVVALLMLFPDVFHIESESIDFSSLPFLIPPPATLPILASPAPYTKAYINVLAWSLVFRPARF